MAHSNNERVIVTLVDADGNIIERRTCKASMLKVARFCGIKTDLEHDDKFIIESEEL